METQQGCGGGDKTTQSEQEEEEKRRRRTTMKHKRKRRRRHNNKLRSLGGGRQLPKPDFWKVICLKINSPEGETNTPLNKWDFWKWIPPKGRPAHLNKSEISDNKISARGDQHTSAKVIFLKMNSPEWETRTPKSNIDTSKTNWNVSKTNSNASEHIKMY